MSLKDKHSIFESPSQDLQGIQPEDIRMLYDRVAVRDLGEDEQVGSIFLPDVSRDKARLRIGIVVSVGPGDAWTEHGLDAQGEPRRRGVTIPCQRCGGSELAAKDCESCKGTGRTDQWFDIRKYTMEKARLPMMCKPGDKVLYDRRREAEFTINGQRYTLLHEEQSIIAVLED